ncbi:hypothetical protein RIF29_04498 [Crotalaria pallida]|uniref:Uncharacterized protein n=1 Tax=Crotalaria pallida TaxID=3830 RepID=A0AAN9J1A0_CROPI
MCKKRICNPGSAINAFKRLVFIYFQKQFELGVKYGKSLRPEDIAVEEDNQYMSEEENFEMKLKEKPLGPPLELEVKKVNEQHRQNHCNDFMWI